MTLRSWEDAKGDVEITTDVLIVGAGPGGAAAARVLAEAGRDVMVLEEGPSRSRFAPNYPNVMRYHMQEGGSMVAMGDAAVAVAAGRGVGGGSLINSAICWRTPHPILESWTEVLGGDDRFRPDAMEPVFDELSEILEIKKTWPEIAGVNNSLIVRGARKLGMEADLLHRNAPTCIGCGLCNLGCPSGGKASVDRNLIPMARAAGAVVQGDAKVVRLLTSGDRVTGVVAQVSNTDSRERTGTITVHADTVILSAGAVGTPRLLHHSGVADGLGPRVGMGLHLHPGNGVLALCDFEVKMWTGATQGAYFIDEDLPGVLPHTLSMPPGALLMAMGGMGAQAKEHLRMAKNIAGCLVMVSDKGEGTVGARADGRADMTYRFEEVDIDNMRKGLKRTCEVLLAGGARKLLVPIVGVGWVDSIDEAFRGIDEAPVTMYKGMYAAHPMATCRMGTDLDNSVIGPDGQTHGMKGLYIMDSSIFPTSLGVNPQLTTMAMSTILARGLVA